MNTNSSFFSLVLLCILFVSCGRRMEVEEEATAPAEMAAEETTSSDDQLIGDWNVDSSVFINDGVRGEASPPIVTTTWTFGENGDYKAVQSMVISGTYRLSGNEIIINSMSIENHHEIVEMTDKKLVLSSIIFETGDNSMKTMVYLTKK